MPDLACKRLHIAILNIMLNKSKTDNILPVGIWVISLYFIEGLPYALVNNVSVALFKTLQISNSKIGLCTSLFYIPWAIKFLWAPLVDSLGTKHQWISIMQSCLAFFVFILAISIFFSCQFSVLCLLFTLLAFISATYDIACDAYYLDTLNKADQSIYIGWRNTAYKIAWLFASGFLVYLAGKISSNNLGWFITFSISAIIFAIASLFHTYKLPRYSLKPSIQLSSQESSQTHNTQPLIKTFINAFYSFFQQKKIAIILLWILLFRAGDAMLLKMAQPFLLDGKEKGGLALSLSDVGFIYGSLGMICLLLGGLLGGWLVFKYGLRKCLLPAALLQSLTLPLYWFLAIVKPNLTYIAMVNGFEQFVYGLATAAYTNFLFTLTREKFVASHYAIATGFMAIGMILPGTISGYLVDAFGYKQFFLFSFLASLPGIICTLRLPFSTIKQQ